MVDLAASDVAARLGLSAAYASWLDMLDALGRPAGGLPVLPNLLVPGWRESDTSAVHFVFGRTPADIDAVQPCTTLEHAIVNHVRGGRHWGMRTGWLRLADQA